MVYDLNNEDYTHSKPKLVGVDAPARLFASASARGEAFESALRKKRQPAGCFRLSHSLVVCLEAGRIRLKCRYGHDELNSQRRHNLCRSGRSQ